MNSESLSLHAGLQQDFGAARQGNLEAFSRLVASTQRMVASVALAITRDVGVSEDIAQETFLSAWQRLSKLDHADSLLPWLRHVARNRAIDHVRALRHRESTLTDADPRMNAAADPGPTPEQALGGEQERALLAAMLDEIPDDSREVLLLFYREGQSSRRVAELLGLSDAAVRKRLQRARAALQSRRTDGFTAMVTSTAPGMTFTAAVSAALSTPGAAKAATVGAFAGKGLLKALLGGAGSVFAAIGLVVIASIVDLRCQLRRARDSHQRRIALRFGLGMGVLTVSFVSVLLWAVQVPGRADSMLWASAVYSLAALWLGQWRRHALQRPPGR